MPIDQLLAVEHNPTVVGEFAVNKMVEPQRPELLLLDADSDLVSCVPILRESFRVTSAPSIETAIEYLRRSPIGTDIVITDVTLNGHETLPMIAAAKQLQRPASILITTADVNRVPDALAAGGDAVLLKPFARNLLFARLSRLRRARTERLQTRAERAIAKSIHLRERSNAAIARETLQSWPNEHCPHCSATSVMCFDFVSHRRAWYACLACKKVWIAKRLDQ